ncbi:kinase-like domain-containing protein [Crucibulum laeve]|uniref:Kinase-like domain-containing protein n=1 Tax=Crucibulum laeve TaxID=68775 RepID=A0A5C3M974_9AGAR|nr:kinase-like domain-containing protein [Crucibulum laeve]
MTHPKPYMIPPIPVPFPWPKTASALFGKVVEESNRLESSLRRNSTASSMSLPEEPWQEEGTTSLIFRMVLKRPDPSEAEFDGKTLSNAHNIATSYLSELRVLRTVSVHPNIVRFAGIIEGVGIILEQIDGVELQSKFPTSDDLAYPSPVSKIQWATGTMDALIHLHSFHLSHSDLSPWNILITKDDQAKLIDFGRSTTLGERVFPASPPFSAPEIKYPDPSADGILADAYSYGVVLLCLDINRMLDPNDDVIQAASEPSSAWLFGDLIALYLQDHQSRSRLVSEHKSRFKSDNSG